MTKDASPLSTQKKNNKEKQSIYSHRAYKSTNRPLEPAIQTSNSQLSQLYYSNKQYAWYDPLPPWCMIIPSEIHMFRRNQQRLLQIYPRFTPQNVTKYLIKNEFTERGHMQQNFKNFQSTKTKSPSMKVQKLQERTGDIFTIIINSGHKLYTDIPVPFPIRSSKGKIHLNYVLLWF